MEKSPDAFRTISEVAEHLETPAHVLRFWESRFPQIRPVKRAGGRRYYRPADVALLTGIKRLLHDEGMTIRGVQKILREQGVRFVSGMADETSTEEDDAALEAALAASVGGEVEATPIPHAEAESAQVIALQTALAAPTETSPTDAVMPAEDLPAAVEDGATAEESADAHLTGADIDVPDDQASESHEPPVTDEPSPTRVVPETPARQTPPWLAGRGHRASRSEADGGSMPDLFSRLTAEEPPTSPDGPEQEPAGEPAVEIIDFRPSVPQRVPPRSEVATDTNAAEPTDAEEVAEAPMAVWAEEEASEDAAPSAADVTPLPLADTTQPAAAPVLRVTRIGPASGAPVPTAPVLPPLATATEESAQDTGETIATDAPAVAPEAEPAASLAARLRRTDPDSLAPSDRSTITVVRARARSLRDRLSAPHRPSV